MGAWPEHRGMGRGRARDRRMGAQRAGGRLPDPVHAERERGEVQGEGAGRRVHVQGEDGLHIRFTHMLQVVYLV
jgi:hypothetical protein